MRVLLFALCLLLVACSATTVPEVEKNKLAPAEQEDIIEMQQQLGDLPAGLGTPDYQQTFAVNTAQGCLLLTPLEAEDEIRFLACLKQNNEITLATAFGLAETTWFSRARAEILSHFEGWIFFYDLQDGQRRISSYFEGSTLLFKQVDLPLTGLAVDPLLNSQAFSCLVLELSQPPTAVTSSIFLNQSREDMLNQVATQLTIWLACLLES